MARARADGSSFFQFALGYYATHAPGVPGEIRLWDEYLAFRDTPAGQKQRVGGLIGSPDTIRERLHRFEESNVERVTCRGAAVSRLLVNSCRTPSTLDT